MIYQPAIYVDPALAQSDRDSSLSKDRMEQWPQGRETNTGFMVPLKETHTKIPLWLSDILLPQGDIFWRKTLLFSTFEITLSHLFVKFVAIPIQQ